MSEENMISGINNVIISRLPNNHALIMKEKLREDYSPEQENALARLKQRDTEVRQHEASHLANPELIAGNGPRYSYEIGPDGKAYALSGIVTVSTGTARSPEDAIRKAQALKNSSAGVSEMSAQDLAGVLSAQSRIQEALNHKSPQTLQKLNEENRSASHHFYAQMDNLMKTRYDGFSGSVDFYA